MTAPTTDHLTIGPMIYTPSPVEEKDVYFAQNGQQEPFMPLPLAQSYGATNANSALPLKSGRRKKWIWISLVLIVIVGGVAGGVAGGLLSKKSSGIITKPNQFVAFGASYVDNGHSRNSSYSASLTASPYYGGRHSNGIVWAEYLAQYLDADLQDYAYSGAMVNNSLNSANVPSTNQQITQFLSDLSPGGSLSGLSNLPSTTTSGKLLISIWIGLNPVMDQWTKTNVSDPTFGTKAVDVSLADMDANIASLSNEINNLRTGLANYNLTASLMILNLPPTESLPYANYTSKGGAKGLALFKNLTDRYNTGLAKAVAAQTNSTSSTVVMADMQSLYKGVFADPSLVSGVNDTTHACLIGTTVCKTPDTHFWWDSIHMTTNAHQYVSQQLLPTVKSLWGI